MPEPLRHRSINSHGNYIAMAVTGILISAFPVMFFRTYLGMWPTRMRCTEENRSAWGSGCFGVEEGLIFTSVVFTMIYLVFFVPTLVHTLLNRGPGAPRGHWWPLIALILVPAMLLGYSTYRSLVAQQPESEYYRSIQPADTAPATD